jgi:hypothetical protein
LGVVVTGIDDNKPLSSTPSTTYSTSTNSSINSDNDDVDDEQDNEDDDESHYDYIEAVTPVASDTAAPSRVPGDGNMTSSDQQSPPSGAVKSKRVTGLFSPDDEPSPPNVQPASAPLTVAFHATVSHQISVFITWPATEPCRSTSSRRPDDSVIGYQLRYKVAASSDSNSYIDKYVTENVALIDGLAPNTKYKYQVRYVRRGETQPQRSNATGWSQEAEFDTGAR